MGQNTSTFLRELPTLTVKHRLRVTTITSQLVHLRTVPDTIILFSHAGQWDSISEVLVSGRQWSKIQDDNVQFGIHDVNFKNATFAGTYEITQNGTTSKFPLRGEFDPKGWTIGWVVSYWSEDTNDHAVGVWSGRGGIVPAGSKRYRLPVIYANWFITHEWSNNTSGFDQFYLSD